MTATIDTVAALRAAGVCAPYAKTLGYHCEYDGGGNVFRHDPADCTSLDNGGSIIVDCNGARWKSVDQREFSVLQWGAVGDGSTDDRPAFAAAIEFLSSHGVPIAGLTCGKLTAPDARIYVISQWIALPVPITIHIGGALRFMQETGTAFVVGQPGTWNNGYDIFIRAVLGMGVAAPAAVDPNGTTGVDVKHMTFSKLEVRTICGFSKVAVDMDAHGDSGSAEVVQHNDIRLGQIVNNGMGLRMRSLAADSSSAQANLIAIQNIYSNACNVKIDDPTTSATNSNTLRINAMDNVSPGSAIGIGLDMHGTLNDLWVGFTGRPGLSMCLRPNARSNTVRFGNNYETDIVVSDDGVNNRVITAPPFTAQLPASSTVVNGAINRNNYGVPIMVYVAVACAATAHFRADVGPQQSQLQVVHDIVASSGGGTVPIALRVPAGGYWRFFTYSGTVFYGPAFFQEAG